MLHDFQLSCGCAFSNAGGVSCVCHPEGSYSWSSVVILAPHIWLDGDVVGFIRNKASFHPSCAVTIRYYSHL